MKGKENRSPNTNNVGRLNIKLDQWIGMLTELRIRGRGVRESGAFLLGSSIGRDRNEVVTALRQIVYYDDLDAECLRGGIRLEGRAFDALWKICNEHELTVVADIHTHPTNWIQQSSIDRTNPMIALRGHIALIVPNFARDVVGITEVGVYEYQGEHRWKDLGASALVAVTIEGSPSKLGSRFLNAVCSVLPATVRMKFWRRSQ